MRPRAANAAVHFYQEESPQNVSVSLLPTAALIDVGLGSGKQIQLECFYNWGLLRSECRG